jgi:hypothetical protein
MSLGVPHTCFACTADRRCILANQIRSHKAAMQRLCSPTQVLLSNKWYVDC